MIRTDSGSGQAPFSEKRVAPGNETKVACDDSHQFRLKSLVAADIKKSGEARSSPHTLYCFSSSGTLLGQLL